MCIQHVVHVYVCKCLYMYMYMHMYSYCYSVCTCICILELIFIKEYLEHRLLQISEGIQQIRTKKNNYR